MRIKAVDKQKIEEYARSLLGAGMGEGRAPLDVQQIRHAVKFSPEVIELLGRMQSESDLTLLSQVYEDLKTMLESEDDTVTVDVTTSVRMDAALRRKVRDKCAESFDAPIFLMEHVEPKIIDGIVLEAKGQRRDASVRTHLRNIRKSLLDAHGRWRSMTIEQVDASLIMDTLRDELNSFEFEVESQEASVVSEVGDGIARVMGLKMAMSGELLSFTSSATGRNVFGLAQNLEENEVGAVLFGEVDTIKEGDECTTTGRVMDIPVGREMLGRVVNPLGQPLDGQGPIKTSHRRPIEFKAPGIMERKPVCEPVQTGLMAIDAMIPIGRGQRELIIGDRKTGKTAIAIDTIINQRDTDIVCIYVAIGQKASTVASIRETLRRHGVLDKTIIVSATAADSAPLQYIAPMAGAAIGEFFMYNDENGNPADADHPGGHVLVVYDDLSKQAVAYRQMSLTLHRPPGREAYPGDIFYLHSRLLERAVKMSDENGGGSMTALPIIETQEGDVSAYIPTNVISITDGQIYLQSNLFFQGQRPAVDVGISVSRVGGAAQLASMKQVAGTLRLDLASYREKQAFSQFGSDLDETTQYQLNHGAHMMELLKQKRYAALDVADQVIAIFAAKENFMDDLDLSLVVPFRDGLAKFMQENHADVRDLVRQGKMSDETQDLLKSAVGEYKAQFTRRRGKGADEQEQAQKPVPGFTS